MRVVKAQQCQSCGMALAIGPNQCVKGLLDGSLLFTDHSTTQSVKVPMGWLPSLKAALNELSP